MHGIRRRGGFQNESYHPRPGDLGRLARTGSDRPTQVVAWAFIASVDVSDVHNADCRRSEKQSIPGVCRNTYQIGVGAGAIVGAAGQGHGDPVLHSPRGRG